MTMESTISTPPMLGVPALAAWVSGTSARTPAAFSSRSRRMTHGPSRMEISRAVAAA